MVEPEESSEDAETLDTTEETMFKSTVLNHCQNLCTQGNE